MKKISAFSFSLVFLIGTLLLSGEAKAESIQHYPISEQHLSISYAKPDSGFMDKLAKGYKIASNLSLENLGEMANMVIFSKKKNVDAIVTDVSNYLDQLSTANKQLKNIKINKNTKVIIKRDTKTK